MSRTKSVGKAVMAPLIAAGASVATRYVAKKGPEFVEETVLPWFRDATRPGGPAEKLQEKARSAVSSGGDLAEQLTGRARDVTGDGGGGSDGGSLSQDELSRRSDERAKRRAQRRRTTKSKKATKATKRK